MSSNASLFYSDGCSFWWIFISSMTPHENKKTEGPFQHKKCFHYKKNVRHTIGVLHLFSIKNCFHDKMDFLRQ